MVGTVSTARTHRFAMSKIKLDKAIAQRNRVQALKDARTPRWTAAAQLVRAIEDWLRSIPGKLPASRRGRCCAVQVAVEERGPGHGYNQSPRSLTTTRPPEDWLDSEGKASNKMNRLALSLLLALGTTAPFTGACAGTGKASTLMAKELPDFPGKEGMVEVRRLRSGRSLGADIRHYADLLRVNIMADDWRRKVGSSD